ncbi:MAG: Holliday junction resolvase RuvX, partial [Bacteroidota bacterium]|nr:Holliday junction resolvase RuvX [Bacteroidota bacterium]
CSRARSQEAWAPRCRTSRQRRGPAAGAAGAPRSVFGAPRRVVRQDERFTSKMSLNSLIQSGAKKKIRKDKAVLDEISATLILQSHLTSNSKSAL